MRVFIAGGGERERSFLIPHIETEQTTAFPHVLDPISTNGDVTFKSPRLETSVPAQSLTHGKHPVEFMHSSVRLFISSFILTWLPPLRSVAKSDTMSPTSVMGISSFFLLLPPVQTPIGLTDASIIFLFLKIPPVRHHQDNNQYPTCQPTYGQTTSLSQDRKIFKIFPNVVHSGISRNCQHPLYGILTSS